MGMSMAQQVAEMSDEERAEVFAGFTEEDYERLQWDWTFWARPEQLVPAGAFIHSYIGGRGAGKCLHIDTPILMHDGTWTTMGGLKDGDTIFDEQGNPTTVVKAHDAFIPDQMYRVTFSDGAYIDTDADHLWITWTHAARLSYGRNGALSPGEGYPINWPAWEKMDKRGRPTGVKAKKVTTAEIKMTLLHTDGKRSNHSIPLTRPVEFSKKERDLPICPEVLGQWLGDGDSDRGRLTQAGADKYVIEDALTKAGFSYTSVRDKNKEDVWKINVVGLKPLLRDLGVYKNKHIPREYLIGSVEQRKNLLAGLMDTDGYYAIQNKSAGISTVFPELAKNIVELLRSLGEKPTVHQYEKYVIRWRPKFNPFHLRRKRDLWAPATVMGIQSYHRTIKSVDSIESSYVRCITVDSPNSLFLAGDGLIPTHNTRAGAEFVRDRAMRCPGSRILLVGRTAGDVNNVMINGDSGIMAISPESERPEHKVSRRMLVWPNGSMAESFSSQEPSQLRGPQGHWAWFDEIGSWLHTTDDSGLNAFDNGKIATRLSYVDKSGNSLDPQIFVSTTPKRTTALTELLEDAVEHPSRVSISRGSTYDNAANLSTAQLDILTSMYEGTEIGRQELLGEMLEDREGALWTPDLINDKRILSSSMPNLPLRVIAVDPSMAEDPKDECGIVVLGATNHRLLHKRTAVVLEDASLKAPPQVWAKVVADLAVKYNAPVVVERNQGGALVPMAVHGENPNIKVYTVWAGAGKATRAEPVVIRYQNGQVRHWGYHSMLESQMITWDPEVTKKSPDRCDALVWGVTALLIAPPKGMFPRPLRGKAPRGRLPNERGTGFTR